MRMYWAAAAAISLAMPAMAQEYPVERSAPDVIKVPKVSDLAAQQRAQREAALLAAPVRSERDLVVYTRTNRASALDALPADVREAFLDSVTFNEKGITGFRYDMLEEHLTPTQSYAVLAMFGAQHTVRMLDESKAVTALDAALIGRADPPRTNGMPGEQLPSGSTNGFRSESPSIGGDYEGYACISRATCSLTADSICMSSC